MVVNTDTDTDTDTDTNMNMKTNKSTRSFEAAWSLLALAFLVLALPAQGEKSSLHFGFHVDGQLIMVEVQDGKVSAEVDGIPLAKEQMQTSSGLVRFKDESGQDVARLHHWKGGGQLVTVPRSSKAYLGLHMESISKGLADHLGLEPREVIYVAAVVKGKAADKAGVHKHDIVIALNGESPVSEGSLRKLLAEHKPGDLLVLRVMRRGEELEIEAKLDAAPLEDMWWSKVADPYRQGIVSPENARRLQWRDVLGTRGKETLSKELQKWVEKGQIKASESARLQELLQKALRNTAAETAIESYQKALIGYNRSQELLPMQGDDVLNNLHVDPLLQYVQVLDRIVFVDPEKARKKKGKASAKGGTDLSKQIRELQKRFDRMEALLRSWRSESKSSDSNKRRIR